MGAVFGKIDVEVPDHQVVYKGDGFEVWRYPSSVAAVVSATGLNAENPPTGKEFTSQGFRALARYIGVFGSAENATRGSADTSEKVAMTAPVVMSGSGASENIAMTAPVVTSGSAESENIAMTAPVVMSAPESEKIAMTGPVVVGAANATGETMAFLLPAKYKTVEDAPVPTNPAITIQMMPQRYEAVLTFSGFFPNGQSAAAQARADELLALMAKANIEPTGRFSLAGYNPPFTLPWLCRNEVHIPVDGAKFED